MQEKQSNATAVYVVDEAVREVLLAIKLKKVGMGNYFPYGGVCKDETSRECIARELDEETLGHIKVLPEAFEYVGKIAFYNGTNKHPFQVEPDFVVDFYRLLVSKEKIGLPPPTDEMGDPNWFAFDSLPKNTKQGDLLFMPSMLSGQPMRGYIHFADDGAMLKSYIVSCTTESLMD